MKLLMIESDEKGIWYFTGLQECANFLNVSYNTMRLWNLGVTKKCKKYKTIKSIERADVLRRYTNPRREKYIEL